VKSSPKIGTKATPNNSIYLQRRDDQNTGLEEKILKISPKISNATNQQKFGKQTISTHPLTVPP
jgi:hypothetical protein